MGTRRLSVVFRRSCRRGYRHAVEGRWEIFVVSILVAASFSCRTPVAFPSIPVEEAVTVPVDVSPELHFLLGQEAEANGRIAEAYEEYRRAIELDGNAVYLLRRTAELASRLERIKEAIEYAERAHNLAGEDGQLRLFLATLYQANGASERAEATLRADDGTPFDPDAAILLYGLLAEQGRLDDAETIARSLREMEPLSLRGVFTLVDLYQRRGDTKAVERVFEEAVTKHPDNLRLYSAMAHARRDRGDRTGELEVYDRILARNPNDLMTLLDQAEALIAVEQVERAIVVLHQAARIRPSDLRITLRLGFLYFENRDYKPAVQYFRQALAFTPEQYEVVYFMGVAQLRLLREDDALVTFDSIPATSDRYGEARTQIAAIYESQGDFHRALGFVRQARAVLPTRSLDLFLASLQAKIGELEGAVAFLNELLDGSSEDLELLYHIGAIYGYVQRKVEALSYMGKVLERDPDHPGALNYVGYSWAEQGVNLDQAGEYIARALERRPEDGYITDSLGWVYYMQARQLLKNGHHERGILLLEQAREVLEQAAEATGGDPVISEHLGDVYLQLGDKARAFEFYREAIDFGPRGQDQPRLDTKHESLRQELLIP